MTDRTPIDPRQYEFFQLVRLLESLAESSGVEGGAAPLRPVGYDHAPSRESVRFRVSPSTAFPVASIDRDDERPELTIRPGEPTELDVTFLGLIGPSGVLPSHYTTLVLQRFRERDSVFREFLDLFHHRTLSLFYRAWAKSRIALHFERAQRASQASDDFADGLMSLAGVGLEGLKGRSSFDDSLYVRFAGLFAQRPRTAIALERMLSDCFGLPITVRQFCGRWLSIAPRDRTRLPDADNRLGQFHELGTSAILGDRLWDCQTKFRLIVGPVNGCRFREWQPTAVALRRLTDLTRAFVGAEFDFDVQIDLDSGEVPPCLLEGGDEPSLRLGWNAWLGECVPGQVLTDAVFSLSSENCD